MNREESAKVSDLLMACQDADEFLTPEAMPSVLLREDCAEVKRRLRLAMQALGVEPRKRI